MCPKDVTHPCYELIRLSAAAPCKGAFRNCKAISSLRGSRQIRLQAAALGSMQSRNTQSTKRSFVRWVYFALKRRGLVREVRFLPFVLSHCFLLNHIYRSVPRSRIHTEGKKLPPEIPMHSYLFQILLPCLFPFFLSWCSFIFCI